MSNTVLRCCPVCGYKEPHFIDNYNHNSIHCTLCGFMMMLDSKKPKQTLIDMWNNMDRSHITALKDAPPKKYLCSVFRTLYKEVEVEAPNENDAIHKAIDKLNDMYDHELDYYESDANVLGEIK